MFTVKGEDRMKLGKQIRKLRMMHSMSQDELAVKMFVSRQTVSNWETDKSYPDIHSLLLLSRLFSVSIDELIKEDIDVIKAGSRSKGDQKISTAKLYLCGIVVFGSLFFGSACSLFICCRFGFMDLVLWFCILYRLYD